MSPRRVSIFFNPGDVFGKWTVTEYAAGSHAKVKCECSCGTTQCVSGHSLTRKENQGCLKCADVGKRYLCPSLNCQPGYRRIVSRITLIFWRCYNPKAENFHNYGGRGISVHLPWHTDRAAMVQYLVTLPGWDDPSLQIDRIDNDGDYTPGNLRFVTPSVNMQNRRRLADGKGTKGICEQCKKVFTRKKAHQRFCVKLCSNRATTILRRHYVTTS